MKFLKILILLSLTVNVSAQNTPNKTNSIRITGYAKMELEPSSYIVDINIRETIGQNNSSRTTFIDLYIDSIEILLIGCLKSGGFDPKKLNQIYLGNYISGSFESGISIMNMTYEYNISNYTELKKFILNLRFNGLSGIRIRKIFDLDKEKIENSLYKIALEDSKKKAESLLTTCNKSLGEIISIEPNYYDRSDDDYNYNNWSGASDQVNFKRKKIITSNVIVVYEIK